MVNFYYNKYNTIEKYDIVQSYSLRSRTFEEGGSSIRNGIRIMLEAISSGEYFETMYRQLTESSPGNYVPNDSVTIRDDGTDDRYYEAPPMEFVSGKLYYMKTNKRYLGFVLTKGSATGLETYHYWTGEIFTLQRGNYTYSQGTLVSSNIIAEDGVLPANGRHTDGFWYVKGTQVSSLPSGTIIVSDKFTTQNPSSRKLVRLGNGWLLSLMVRQNSSMNIMVSRDKGNTWTFSGSVSNNTIKDAAVTAVGNDAVIALQNDGEIQVWKWSSTTSSNSYVGVIVNGVQLSSDGISIFYDNIEKVLFATWARKNGSSYAIYYAKSFDNGATWPRNNIVFSIDVAGYDYTCPSIVAHGSNAYIIARYVRGTNNSIVYAKSVNKGDSFITAETLYDAGIYLATSPIAVVDKSGRVHVTWNGHESTNASIHVMSRYLDDSTNSWIEPTTKIPQSNNLSKSTLTVDQNGNVYVIGENYGNIISYVSKDRGITWSTSSTIVASGSMSQSLYDPTWNINFSGDLNSPPPFIYRKTSDTVIEYKGTFTTNDPPPTPGVFTQPTGSLEIGDSKVVAWGTSLDAVKYILDVSINGGTWNQIGTPTTNSFTYTIPTATSVRFRVKAQGSNGLESGYQTSNVFTVTEPMYYWGKYNTISTPSTSYNLTWNFQFEMNWSDVDSSRAIHGYTSYTVGSNGVPAESGSYVLKYYDDISGSITLYFVSGGNLYRDTASSSSRTHSRYIATIKDVSTGYTYSRGSFIENVVGGYSAYTNNSRNPDGYWYVRGSRTNQSIVPTGAFNIASNNGKFRPNEVVNISFGASTASNISLYEVDYKYNENSWSQLAYNNTLVRTLTTTTDKSLKTLQFRVRAKNTSNVYSDYIYSIVFNIDHNSAPVLTLNNPNNGITLYENDFLNINGTINDIDQNQNLNIYVQIDNYKEQVLETITSGTQIPLTKQLKFKNGKLFSGDFEVSDVLNEELEHSIKVWVEDDEGGKSNVETRSFNVVPNHLPLISINEINIDSIIDTDKFIITGIVSDQDEEPTISLTYHINDGNKTEIYNGTGGTWSFEVFLSQLNVGENAITLEATDNFGAKLIKTIKLNKNEVNIPILESIARYKLDPPKGVAKGVLLFIQRDKDLETKVELSMTMKNENEQFIELVPESTSPVVNKAGILEDTYHHEVIEEKDNIILKITAIRQNESTDFKIRLISGVVE
ncbi:gp425 [Bacillus phage G]|uniref:Gp425 n=1 Tax=Bacillus phage G TaxID=2884420 RepID=G3MAG6_9CAUD|nr:gp425 [Bacillus phage G]AEO93683.1 gp425 [Bacillus phage G]